MNIELYTRDRCIQCAAIERRLDKHGIAYSKHTLANHPDVVADLKGRGYMAAPGVILRASDGSVLDAWGGNNPAKIDAAVDRMVLDPEMEKYVSLVWRGKKILMMHGDNFPLLREMALHNGVDLAISGHTHVGSLVREGGVIFLNPGSTTIPKGRDPESAALLDDEGIRIMTLDGGELHFERW